MIFNSKKKKQVVREFFNYVESEILPSESEPKVIDRIKKHIKDDFELIDQNKWKIAFENLASQLVEHYIILDRKGVDIVRRIIKLCRLKKQWEFDLRRIHSQGYIMGSWKLANAEKLAQENKYTFYKPSHSITEKLEPGNLVKVIFKFESTNKEHPLAERMWVQIIGIHEGKFNGVLDNHPFYLHELYVGDEVNFEHKNIIDHDLEVSEPNLVNKYYNRCFVTNKILYENAPVNYIYREEPMEKDKERDYVDTGWRILSGDETDDYMDNADNFSLVSLGAVLSRDDSFIELLVSETGTSFERNDEGIFVKIEE